jgi:hypothetical protein
MVRTKFIFMPPLSRSTLSLLNRHLIKLFIFTLSISSCINLKGQETIPNSIDTTLFGLTPANKHTVINGIAFGLTAHPWSTWTDTLFIEVNGFNLELGPLGIIAGIWGTMFGLLGVKDSSGQRISFFMNSGKDNPVENYPIYGTHINGLSISVGGISESFNNGLFINGVAGYCYKINGIQLSGLVNNTAELNGVSVAALANIATRVKGVQIGLINNCKTGNVLQIGLFNRIGKRVTPFINFRFKKN